MIHDHAALGELSPLHPPSVPPPGLKSRARAGGPASARCYTTAAAAEGVAVARCSPLPRPPCWPAPLARSHGTQGGVQAQVQQQERDECAQGREGKSAAVHMWGHSGYGSATAALMLCVREGSTVPHVLMQRAAACAAAAVGCRPTCPSCPARQAKAAKQAEAKAKKLEKAGHGAPTNLTKK